MLWKKWSFIICMLLTCANPDRAWPIEQALAQVTMQCQFMTHVDQDVQNYMCLGAERYWGT